MRHFLKDTRNNTLVDIMTTDEDLSYLLCLPAYSLFLLCETERQIEVVQDFDQLGKMSDEFYESNPAGESPGQFVERRLRAMCQKYNLRHETD